ncbi:hypothetical protein A3A03_00455 [Candidatus Nomurabacteria bacterium RIFCSPLOWO2_01_FULL_40_18]|uniref:Uncharacterized protein n=1 Tax=Candidatus Nomurabacteria bacterium RIFCSPLOWO2_01_FULL_40_18 TaxID=1801773 RepID=A0A1F6XH94_9BACT|nr:MAG: hypothetical protein A3A03_00455 [Candidatus Nomurabacteria bacterium RIFCSPLOWO2_01_FULL_40_18]
MNTPTVQKIQELFGDVLQRSGVKATDLDAMLDSEASANKLMKELLDCVRKNIEGFKYVMNLCNRA